MKLFLFSIAWTFALQASSLASAAIVERTFTVQNTTIKRLCKEEVIVTVNGSFPGPTINLREGDTVIVHLINEAPYNITIHWHGVFQLFSGWADGPEYVTQCTISPGTKYTYKFNVRDQEGTLWWHAHASVLRAWVHGAFIIQPRSGQFPFPKPYKQIPLILGDWYNSNVVDIETQALATGGPPNVSNSFTINGLPGDLIFNCSQKEIFKLKVTQGKTYMLRMINAALNNHLFFKIANHNFTVVAVDASYINHYVTDIIVIAPGQTADVLFTANQPIGSYYMAASPYSIGVPLFDNTTTRGIVVYEGATSSSNPLMPTLPPFNDTPTAFKFYSNLTSKVGGPHWVPVPLKVDEHMFITIGLGLEVCDPRNATNATCLGPLNQRFSSSMNNESFVIPRNKGLSMLEAFFNKVSGVYTANFPNKPPVLFNFTDQSFNNSFNTSLLFPPKSTKAKRLKYNSTLEIVFQNTALIGVQNHPMHIHGFSFHVLAQGFGNYDSNRDRRLFNLVNPQIRNTIAVPAGGWAVIRFQANNPGVWFVHCHVEDHVPWGLDMAFEVENGPTPSTSLPPPPPDLPKC